MMHSPFSARLLRVGITVLLTAASTLPAYAQEKSGYKDSENYSPTRLPQYGPAAVVPACYSPQTGEWRLVRPWGVGNTPSLSCRPPAPWDSINAPGNGWGKAVCNTGAAFDCGDREFFLELNSRGLQGPAGATGSQGPTGLTGPQGLKGLQGGIGLQGPAGASGQPGSIGPQGPQGDVGSQGARGDAGAQGTVGLTGPGFTFRGPWDGNTRYVQNDVVTENGTAFIARTETVAVDPAQSSGVEWAPLATKGATGAIGPQGDAGMPGVQGPTGPAGATGSQGPMGRTGSQGPEGVQGGIGPQGPTGAAGQSGSIGPQGPQGDIGSAGARGDAGVQGPIGPTGPGFTFRGAWDGNTPYVQNDVVTENGAAFIARIDSVAVDPAQSSGVEWAPLATQGATGSVGLQGDAGVSGAQGPAGPAGATGAVGPTGPTGAGAKVTDISPNGSCGTVAGVSITDGANHTSIVCDGAKGATGATGPTGPAGTTGQSSATVFTAAGFVASAVTAPAVPPAYYVPGLTQTITVPANAVIHIESTGGVQTMATTVPGFSVLDVWLYVDYVQQQGGKRRLIAANATTADKAIANWQFAQSVTLSAGDHTIFIAAGQAAAASGAGSIVGSAAATVGGASFSSLQGTLTITLLKQ